MQLRTITTGLNLTYPVAADKIKKIARFNLTAKNLFKKEGYAVQTTRISSQPWPEHLGHLPQSKIIGAIKTIEKICDTNGVDFFNIGTCFEPRHIDLIPEIINASSRISASATIATRKNGINHEAIKNTARAILAIANKTKNGYGNFRFAAIANCPPDIPFYPASYHHGPTCFSIGLEASSLVYRAFAKSKNLNAAEKNLHVIMQAEYKKIEKIARRIGKSEKIYFKGVDTSPAPSIRKNESIAYAFEKLRMGKFGEPGTLMIASMITGVLKRLRIKQCGYSGLMFPILEDYGLAKRWSERYYNVDTLLSYSAICGTGLDCIPLPGDITKDKICSILLDVAALSLKLNKPLSARLLPAPNKSAGQTTGFRSPYLVNCQLTKI